MALASSGARADGSTCFLVAYRTLANWFREMTSKRSIRLRQTSTRRVCIDQWQQTSLACISKRITAFRQRTIALCSTAGLSCKYKLVWLGRWCVWVVQCHQRWRCCSGPR